LHVTYIVRSFTYGDYSELGYTRSLDSGSTWEKPLILAQSTTAPGVDQIASFVFGNDEIHLTYDTPERMHQWSEDGGTTWHAPEEIVNGVNLGAAFGGENKLVKDSAGVLHVVYAWAEGVYHATWNGPGGVTQSPLIYVNLIHTGKHWFYVRGMI